MILTLFFFKEDGHVKLKLSFICKNKICEEKEKKEHEEMKEKINRKQTPRTMFIKKKKKKENEEMKGKTNRKHTHFGSCS